MLAAILSPGKKLAGAIKGQPGKVAALIKAVEEKAKEKEGSRSGGSLSGISDFRFLNFD